MTKKRQKPLHLDMSFDEALRRVAQTDPRELPKPKPKKGKKQKQPSRPPKATDRPEL
jgi:hypothetical protein